MPLIKDGTLENDPWVLIKEGEVLSKSSPSILSLNRLLDEYAKIGNYDLPIGLRLKSDEFAEQINVDINKLSLIELEFPVFTDGRAYSNARIIREQLKYKGELRAVGNVLRDQFLFMHRCGFNSFKIKEEESLAGWLSAITSLSVWYQPTSDLRVCAPYLRSAKTHDDTPRKILDVEADIK